MISVDIDVAGEGRTATIAYMRLLEACALLLPESSLALFWGAAALSLLAVHRDAQGPGPVLEVLWSDLGVKEALVPCWERLGTWPRDWGGTSQLRAFVCEQIGRCLGRDDEPWNTFRKDGLTSEEATLVLAVAARRASTPLEDERELWRLANMWSYAAPCLGASSLAPLLPAVAMVASDRRQLQAILKRVLLTGWLALGCALEGAATGTTIWLGERGVTHLSFGRDDRSFGRDDRMQAEVPDWRDAAEALDPRLLPSVEEVCAQKNAAALVAERNEPASSSAAPKSAALLMPAPPYAPVDRLSVFLKSVVLPPQATETLEEALQVYDPAQQPPPSFLFYGPPGTGKTHAAKQLSFALGLSVEVVTIADTLGYLVGETEKALMEAFRGAAKRGAMLFLDEADAFLNRRGPTDRLWEITHVNTVLQALDQRQCPVVFATNRADILDDAVRRRITWMVEFPLPGQEERRQIWKLQLDQAQIAVSEETLAGLALLHLSGGLIANAVSRVKRSSRVRHIPSDELSHQLVKAAKEEQPKLGSYAAQSNGIGFRGDN